MGRFLLGLIVGAILGILAMSMNPDLPQQLRVTLANLTGLVMRGVEEAADKVGDAADEAADKVGDAADEAADEVERATEGGPGDAGQPAEPAPQ
jgi:gas vesicle protein